MNLFPYQSAGVQGVHDAIARGETRIVLTSPTGGGKSLMLGQLLKDYLAQGKKSIVYVNKKLLTSQLEENLTEMGIEFGVMAAGFPAKRWASVQLASMQTVHARLTAEKWDLHDAALVIIEEAHIQQGPTAAAIIEKHREAGAKIVGITATPVDMAGMYDCLVVAGTNSELRKCGRLVLARHFGVDEPDLKALKLKHTEGVDLTESQNRKAMMTPTIYARVGEWYRKLNPEQKPTLMFAPGVNESYWFAERFWKSGIPAAHIDGDNVWINGEFLPSGTSSEKLEARKQLRDMSQSGEVKVVVNRFVLREGVNWPWVQHMILGCVLLSLQTYLQIVGRGLRAWPGKECVTIQDHGGSWWRHGSANADRVWDLSYTNSTIAGLRADRIRAKKEREPWLCPNCRKVINPGQYVCECGRERPRIVSRPVVAIDGSLREMTGDIYKPLRYFKRPNGPKLWERMYWRSRTGTGSRTFKAAMSLFAKENYYQWPDPSWPFMPKYDVDYYRLVADVPRDRLH